MRQEKTFPSAHNIYRRNRFAAKKRRRLPKAEDRKNLKKEYENTCEEKS